MIHAGSKITISNETRSTVAGIAATDSEGSTVYITIRPTFELTDLEMLAHADTPVILDQGAADTLESGDPIWKMLLGLRPVGDNLETILCASTGYGALDVPLFINDVLTMRGDFSVAGRVVALKKTITVNDWNGRSLDLSDAIEIELEDMSDDLQGQGGRVFDDELGRPVGVLTSRNGGSLFLAPIRPFANHHGLTICDVLSSNYENMISSLNEEPVYQLADYADG